MDVVVTYLPGDATAAFTEGAWLLLDARPDSQIAHDLWLELESGARLPSLLDTVAKGGLGAAPDFAFALSTGPQVRFVVRGNAHAVVSTDTERIEIDSGGLATWAERLVEVGPVGTIQLSIGDGLELPTVPANTGVFLANRIDIQWARSPELPAVPDAELPLQGEPDPRTSIGRPSEYSDLLYGATSGRSVEDAAIRPQPTGDTEAAEEPIMTRLPVGDQLDTRSDLDADVGLATLSNSALPSPTPEPADGDEMLTIQRSDLPVPGFTPGSTITIVAARICPDRHPNRPDATSCRTCNTTIPEQESVNIPRPALGHLILSGGTSVVLDRPVILGRSPRAHADSERPHLVKLPNASGDISRNHVEVTLDGWDAFVTDLNSTNGTWLTPPGSVSQMLNPMEPKLLPPGTKVTLAEDMHFTFEVSA